MSKVAVHNQPLWRAAWRRMRRRPFQYILFVLGVAIGVAMMVSIDLASGSASRAFELSTTAITGQTTHRLVADSTGLDEAVYTGLRTELGFSPAAPVVEGYVQSPELGEQPLRLIGMDLFAEPPFRSYFGNGGDDIGDLVAFLAEPNTLLLTEGLAEATGVALGDTITLDDAGQRVPFRIVGLLQPGDEVNQRALSSVLFTDIANAQPLLGLNGRLSYIDLIVNNDADLARIEAFLPEGVRLETASARSNTVQQMTAAFELNLTALSLLALVVGMFLIYNTVSFSVVQRRPLFGILRCLGVTGGQLFGLIVGEAAVLGLIGSLLGVGLGVVLGQGMVRLVTQTINDLYFVVNVQNVAIPPAALVRGLLIGVAAALLAAAVPAREAMKTAPQSTLRRSTIESNAQRLLPWLVVAWLALSAIGTLLLWLRTNSLVIAFAGLFAVLFGFALLTPPITAVFMRWLTPVGSKLLGVLGRMAPRDIVRSLSRTSVAIAALMVAVSVIVGVSIMIGSFRQTVTLWLSDTLQADVYLAPPRLTASETSGTLPGDVVATAVNFPGVVEAITTRQIEVALPELNRRVNLHADSGDVSQGQRQYLWQGADLHTIWDRFLAGEGVMITEPLYRNENMSLPPEPITIDTPAGPRTLPVLAVYYDYASQQGSVHIGRPLYDELWQDDSFSTMALFLEPRQPIEPVVAALQEAFNGRSDVQISSNQSLRENALVIFDRTFAITAALRLLAVVVAFIGVLSALMSLQLERAREFGVLRATGMTVRQLWQLTLLETGLMGSTAGLLALPTGFVLAYILIYVINLRSFGWTLQMQLEPRQFINAFLVALGAALLAGLYPALRVGKMVVATAVRSE